MKKILILGLAVILLASFASAGGLSGKGIKAGINLANLTGDDVEDASMKLGLAVGGFITYSFNDMFAIQPEVLFMMKGAKEEYDMDFMGVTASVENTMKLTYIEIPILLKFTPKMEGSFAPNLFLGPALGINMSAKYESEYTVAGTTESEDGDIDDIKGMDFGLAFGAGAGVPLGNGTLTFDARYTLGLTTILDMEGDPDVKNAVISFLVGYGF